MRVRTFNYYSEGISFIIHGDFQQDGFNTVSIKFF